MASRDSKLALWQTHFVQSLIQKSNKNINCNIRTLKTMADKWQTVQLKDMGGKGVFVKELDDLVLAGDVDCAVHSLKDVPSTLPEGLEILAMLEREDNRDAFISRHPSVQDLPLNALIGTSSLRRQLQIKRLRPDLKVNFLRGNVLSRMQKRDDFDAILLAVAGLKRLGIDDYHPLSCKEMLPAIGQGIICVVGRTDREDLRKLLEPLNDINTFICGTIERKISLDLHCDCHSPIAAFAEIQGDRLCLEAKVFSVENNCDIAFCESIALNQSDTFAAFAVSSLVKDGALKLLELARQ